MRGECPCMKHPSWSTSIGVTATIVGKTAAELVDRAGACEAGVRDILVCSIVACIMSTEGEGGVRDIDTILSEVKRRITIQ